MAWRTVAAVIIVVFVLVAMQSTLAGPLMKYHEEVNATDTYSGNDDVFDSHELISDMPGAWFNMGLVGIFGFMTWGVYRVLRRELTRGRL